MERPSAMLGIILYYIVLKAEWLVDWFSYNFVVIVDDDSIQTFKIFQLKPYH